MILQKNVKDILNKIKILNFDNGFFIFSKNKSKT